MVWQAASGGQIGRGPTGVKASGSANGRHQAIAAALTEDGAFAEAAVLDHGGSSTLVVVPSRQALEDTRTGRPGDLFRVMAVERLDETFDRIVARMRPIPKTPEGDIDVGKLAGELSGSCVNSKAPEPIPGPVQALGATAVCVWRQLQSRASLPLQMDLSPTLDLGIDSISWVELLLELEQVCGVSMSESDVARIRSVYDLVQCAAKSPRVKTLTTPAPGNLPPLLKLSPDEAGWLKPRNWAMRQGASLFYLANKLIVRSYFGLTVCGLERLPENAPYVIAMNHLSDLDQSIIAAALPYQRFSRATWAGDRPRLFSNPVTRLFCRTCKVFPVDDNVARSTIASACAALADGRILMWFPEGWRSPDGRLQPFARGLGAILHHRPVPVVPALIEGAYEAMPRGRRLPKPVRLKITFGNPLLPDQLKSGGTSDELADLMQGLAGKISALANGRSLSSGEFSRPGTLGP